MSHVVSKIEPLVIFFFRISDDRISHMNRNFTKTSLTLFSGQSSGNCNFASQNCLKATGNYTHFLNGHVNYPQIAKQNHSISFSSHFLRHGQRCFHALGGVLLLAKLRSLKSAWKPIFQTNHRVVRKRCFLFD